MVFFYQDIRLVNQVSGRSEEVVTKLTNPLKISMDDTVPVQILQSVCNINQLSKPVTQTLREKTG